MKYKKCPRCDVNYILENEDYCEICKKEMKGILPFPEEDDDDAVFAEELCPKCKVNYVAEGEKYCDACLREMEAAALGKLTITPDWDDDEVAIDEDVVIVGDLGIEEPVLDDEEELSLDELAEKEGWEEGDDIDEIEDEDDAVVPDIAEDDFEQIDLDDPSLDLADDDLDDDDDTLLADDED